MPQPGIDVAALEQLFMRADVVHRAAFEHEDLVRRNQRGETVVEGEALVMVDEE